MFYEVFPRVLILIAIALLGYFCGKKFKINSKDISTLLIYVFTPIVCFHLILKSKADITYVMYAAIFYVTATVSSYFALIYSNRFLWKDSRSNLFAAAAGHGNIGYFVLPLAISLLNGMPGGDVALGIVVFMKIASSIYEFTMAWYFTARSEYSVKQSLVQIVKMPTLHASILALVLKSFNFHMPSVVNDALMNFTGAYSVLGMMMVGMSLARFEKLIPDWKFAFNAILWKHVIYAGAVIIFFSGLFHLTLAEKIIMLMVACTPLAGNIAAVAVALNVHPEKAAFAIMSSTLLAIITVPLTISYVLPLL